jgi:ATP-dependent protease HslVU (ClpYQ) peptidase subunit
MRHEAGLEKLDKVISLEMTLTENIKKNEIGEVIENQIQHYSPGIIRAYHGITRDWITNEIFRRIEPN